MNIDIPAESIVTPEFEAALQQALEAAFGKLLDSQRFQELLRSSEPDKLLIPADETARLLSICPKSLWNRTAPRGPIPCVKIGSRVMYSPADLQAWIDSQKQKGGGE